MLNFFLNVGVYALLFASNPDDLSELTHEIRAFFANEEFEELDAEFLAKKTQIDESIEELSIIKTIKCSLCKKALNKVMEKVPKGAAKVDNIFSS